LSCLCLGNIPSFGEALNLKILLLNDNNFDGTISTTNTSEFLMTLLLHKNKLSINSLDAILFQYPQLKTLSVYSNPIIRGNVNFTLNTTKNLQVITICTRFHYRPTRAQ